MAFYEMLPGAGMPPGLQAGMDSVLNKKFGTSTTYPAEGWPDTVNLMGPLPEKTASGAIATFSDGADSVPLKKCEITLPASLDGYSSVDVVSAGKNLIPFTVDYLNFTQTQNGMTISVLSNGKVKFNGTTTAVTNFSFYQASVSTAPHFYVKNGTYTYSCYGSASVKMIVSGGSNNGFPYREITNGSCTGTVTDDTKPFNYVIFRIDSGVTLSDIEVEPMLEYGSTATAYTEYVQPTTHTASLGRTIYGGTADVVSGTGTDGYGYVDLGSLTWTKRNTSSGHWRFTTQDVPVIINDDSSHVPDMDCGSYTAISPTQSWNGVTGVSCNTSISQLMVCDEQYETASDFKTAVNGVYLVYPLSTTETFTFDPVPIDSKLGNNTIWSEQGDTEVTYRADINLALGGN